MYPSGDMNFCVSDKFQQLQLLFPACQDPITQIGLFAPPHRGPRALSYPVQGRPLADRNEGG